ncbi:hypothetical protein BDW59DRAFT_112690 [Aspergillus cavernicola]|uniref:Uncharacterized protein n=1 Tax=Aspergillus cavernicola TaxID=176166 RepID=A0ABR4HZG8_9EURO
MPDKRTAFGGSATTFVGLLTYLLRIYASAMFYSRFLVPDILPGTRQDENILSPLRGASKSSSMWGPVDQPYHSPYLFIKVNIVAYVGEPHDIITPINIKQFPT